MFADLTIKEVVLGVVSAVVVYVLLVVILSF